MVGLAKGHTGTMLQVGNFQLLISSFDWQLLQKNKSDWLI